MFLCMAMLVNEEDKNLFEHLYHTYRDRMIALAKAQVHDYHVAEDIVQEAFFRILKNIEKFSPMRSNKPYGLIVIIVRNLCRDRYRHVGRMPEISLEDWMGEQEPVDVSFTYQETYLEFVEIIKQLEEEYRDALMLKVLYDYTYEEMAKMLGVSQNLARVRVSRGRQKLKKILQESGGTHG